MMAHTPFPLVKSVPLLSLSHHITHIDSHFHLLHTRGGSTIEIKETLPIRSILFILIYFIVKYALPFALFLFWHYFRWIRSVPFHGIVVLLNMFFLNEHFYEYHHHNADFFPLCSLTLFYVWS